MIHMLSYEKVIWSYQTNLFQYFKLQRKIQLGSLWISSKGPTKKKQCFKFCQRFSLNSIRLKYLPTKLFIAINTIEVGVDIFSLILKSRLRIEKEQISTPLPVTPEKIPPRKPVKTKLTACQVPKF